ncbi:MAG TPA: hypothetical protein VK597_07985 [Inquilinus sp.]|nr:hypothetical protein [Inquilinus sp.]
MDPRHPWLRRALDLAPLILLMLLVAAFGLIDARVVTPDSLRNVLAQATPVALLGLGAFVVLLTGGIDLSAGVAVAFCSVVMAGRLDAGDPLALALLAGLATMALLGLLNGLLVGLIAAGAWWLMRRTRFGLRTYAIGSDPAAAQLAGVPLPRQQLLTYLVAAVFTFLTAVLMISRVPVVTPNLGGTALLLDAIAAAVLGGTSIFGGRGTVLGVVVGAVIVSLLTNALRVFGVDPSSIDLFKGAIIVLALIADAGIRMLRLRLDEGRIG